jgi:carbon-monoxide dehydrogenase large subunit
MAVVRSPYAHARITSIDTAAAKAAEGVVAVFTGADLRDDWKAAMPCAWPVTEDMKSPSTSRSPSARCTTRATASRS